MQLKKFLSLFIVLCLFATLCACQKPDNPTIDAGSSSQITSSEPEPVDPYADCVINPLTGEKRLDPAKANTKPIAVSINNIGVAQPVQAGLHKADVLFETEVEGGITRMLAVFSDPSDLPAIGTIRSLRVPFADIAAGMKALLIYHGIDYTYCLPHLSEIKLTSYTVSEANYGFREKNGLAVEHTLYTSGEKLEKLIKAKKYNMSKNDGPWLNFASTEEKTAPAEGTASGTVTVKYNSTTTVQFIYNAETKRYSRAKKGVPYKELKTGEEETFGNVFVLETTISNYPDGYHRRVDLSSGSGYYISAGGYEKINWKKGSPSDNFSFTKADGTTLTVNQGNSYVCIMNKTGQVTF